MWQHTEQYIQGHVPQPHQIIKMFELNDDVCPTFADSTQRSVTPLSGKQEDDQQQGNTTSTMMDVVAHCSNPRASRNMAEKQRRDNLNTQIQTMASLVPTVSGGGSRKKDKISVLRLTAAHLRIAYTLGLTSNSFLPRKYNDIDLENCLIETLSGNTSFLLVVTSTGKIIYVSRHVERHLGHEQTDMIGDSLYHYVYQDDHEVLAQNLTLDESVSNLTCRQESANEGNAVKFDSDKLKEQRKSCSIRMALRTSSRRENVQYEYFQVSGVLKPAFECKNGDQNSSNFKMKDSTTANDIIFVGTARLLEKKTISELSLMESNKNEYFTRHLVDGRIIYCDHRISVVSGYMSEEVSGTSAFKFMHKDDVRWTIIALRHMYDAGKSYGSSCYRLMTKTGDFIYLRTHGYLEIDQKTQTVTSFICINTLTSKDEGEKLIEEMKRRFSATISSTVKAIRGTDELEEPHDPYSHEDNSKENVEDLSQLEDAITHLISDLPSPVRCSDDRGSPEPPTDAQFFKATIYAQHMPPALIQASQIGIKDLGQNGIPHVGKGKMIGKKSIEEPGQKTHVTKSKSTAGKSIKDLEDSKSPPQARSLDQDYHPNKIRNSGKPESHKNGTKPTTSDGSSWSVDSHSEPGQKRPFPKDQDNGVNNPKKRAMDNFLTLELITSLDETPYQNVELDYPSYISVQPANLDTNALDVSDVYELNNDALGLEPPDQYYVDIQSDQLSTSGTGHGSLTQYDDDQPEMFQYSNTGRGIITDSVMGQMEIPDSLCDSQFSVLDELDLQAQCDSFIAQAKPELHTQKQKLKPAQQSRYKKSLNVKSNIGV